MGFNLILTLIISPLIIIIVSLKSKTKNQMNFQSMNFIERVYFSFGIITSTVFIICVLIYILMSLRSSLPKTKIIEKLILYNGYIVLIIWLISIIIIRYNM